MRRSYLMALFGFMTLPILSGCSKPPNFWEDATPGQKRILVSFPPLYSMTHAVAGEDAYVLSMLSSQGPHGYEHGTSDILKLNHADLFIYNGLTLDDNFVEKLKNSHKNKSLVMLNVGDTLLHQNKKLILKGDPAQHHGHDHGPGANHQHGEEDPHLWLGPKQAMAMTRIIAAKLGEIDPPNAKKFEKRADAFVAKLKDLQDEGAKAFEGKHVHMLTMHESFGYFADAFNLEIVGAIQKIPGLDPDDATRAKLVKLCKEKHVTVIAVEPQYSTKQAETLRDTLKRAGVDVQIVMLDPLETADLPAGKKNPDPEYYLKKMRENIDTLAKALK